MIRRELLLFAFLILSLTKLFSTGLGDWSLETKEGTLIHNFYGGVFIDNGFENYPVKNIDKFFLYEKRIIGICDCQEGEYFIYDEVMKESIFFTIEEVWKSELTLKGLNPIWKRWHSDFLSFLSLFRAIFVYIPFVCIVFLLPIWLIYFSHKKYKNAGIQISYKSAGGAVLIIFFLIFQVYLDNHYQSFF